MIFRIDFPPSPSVATEVGKNSHKYISVWRVAYSSLPTRQFISRKVKNLPTRQAEVGNLFDSDGVVGIFAYSYGNTDKRPEVKKNIVTCDG